VEHVVSDSEWQDPIRVGIRWSIGLALAVVVVWMMSLITPTPLDSLFSWILPAAIGVFVLALLVTIGFCAMAYLTRDDR
jgi:uncharacterized membrane protein YhdT